MENDLKQLIISSILGDGSFTKITPPAKNSRLSIAHCIGQYDLIKFKWDILNKYNLAGKLSKNKIINSRYKKGYIEEYRFKSFSDQNIY